MEEIINFMTESDDEIALGGHSEGESDLGSDWEYEVEAIPMDVLQQFIVENISVFSKIEVLFLVR